MSDSLSVLPVVNNNKDIRLAKLNRKQNLAKCALVLGVLAVAVGVFFISATLSKKFGDAIHIPNVSKSNFPMLMSATGIAVGLTSSAIGGCLSFHYKEKKLKHQIQSIELN